MAPGAGLHHPLKRRMCPDVASAQARGAAEEVPRYAHAPDKDGGPAHYQAATTLGTT